MDFSDFYRFTGEGEDTAISLTSLVLFLVMVIDEPTPLVLMCVPVSDCRSIFPSSSRSSLAPALVLMVTRREAAPSGNVVVSS